jgi:hypothetical protein
MEFSDYVHVVQDKERLGADHFAHLCIAPLKKASVWEIATKSGLHTHENLEFACTQIERIIEKGGLFFTFNVQGNIVLTSYASTGTGLAGKHCENGGIPLPFKEGIKIYTPEFIVRSAQEIMHYSRILEPYPLGFVCALWVRVNETESHASECCKGKLEHFRKLRDDWLWSAQCQAIDDYLKEATPYKRVVQKIACFDLGALDEDQHFLQHVVAARFRDVLQELNAGGIDEFKVEFALVAQCRQYCDNCKTILKELLGTDVLENQRALLAVDDHTFIMLGKPCNDAISPAAVSMNNDSGGPAAIFSTQIVNDRDPHCFFQELNLDLNPTSPLLRQWFQQCGNGPSLHFYRNGNVPGSEAFDDLGIVLHWREH